MLEISKGLKDFCERLISQVTEKVTAAKNTSLDAKIVKLNEGLAK
jgi:hypothetical protein